MDSWSYGRSVFLDNGTVLPSDSFAQNRNAMSGFDQRLSNELENDNLLMSELTDRSFADMVGKSNGLSSVSITKVASSSCVVPPSLFPLENQSSSLKFSSVATQELTKLDFKLRSFLDYGNNGTPSRAFALPTKKPRASNMSLEKPLCQVYGCNMDLSLSKDYHKKHRVCEAHSKTSVVIVSGIEQRFCQQCSRFHFLSEFDDGKRSCRRRLAGHNERRRKPSFYFLPDKRHKLLHTSQGNKFLENSSDKNLSLVLPESFPGSLLYRVIDESDHRASRLMSFKDKPAIGQNSSMIYGSKPLFYSPEASGVSSVWDLDKAASRSTCALSLLSSQSQQQYPETPNTTFSITQPNQNLNLSPNHYQMEPLWIDPRKTNSEFSSCNGKISSTVDLLQLSSHLQRIEQQRNLTDDVKQEHNQLYFPCS